MMQRETERRFLSVISESLLSLPSDLKVLQEAVADPDLDRGGRDVAAGAIVHTLLPQEGAPSEGPLRYVDDVLYVRAALAEVAARGGEGVGAFRDRFSDVYGRLDEDIALFSAELGETWRWLSAKVEAFSRLPFKGKRASQYVDDDEGQSFLYEEGLEFETNYNVTEEQVKNRLRRVDQVVELLARRRSDEARRIA
jgi:hypothetical protein